MAALPLTPVMAFIDTSETIIVVEVPQIYARYIKPGQTVEIAFKFLPGTIQTGNTRRRKDRLSPWGFPNRCKYGSLHAEAVARGWQQMGRAIEITCFEHSATELRELAARTQNGAMVRRLLAIALVLEDYPREAAAHLNGMDRQTLRDWLLRYNAEGVAGLRSRCSPGRPPVLNEVQMEELRTIVLEGPDLERNKVVRWRCVDLRAEIASRWSVSVAERTVGKLLRRLGMTRLQPRPHHPKKDAAAQATFKKTSPAW